MNAKTLAIVALLLWVASAAFVGFKFITGSTVIAEDGREAIQLTTDERNLVLGEMRALLAAVQEIIAAVNAGDMNAVKESAHRVGMAEAGAAPAGLVLKLPMAFKTLGFSTHEGFDEVALAAEIGAEAVLAGLETNLAKCVACHAAYRLNE
ncbi:MAG: hypothetical protein NUV50_03095 [Rhodospirillales bacterium]|nr:hypothetical protein [Rhodospirillales bacterium]